MEFNHWSRIKTTHYWQPTFNWTIFVCKTLLCMVMSSILGQGIPIYILLSDIAAEGKIFRSFIRYLNSSNPKRKAFPLLFMSHVFFLLTLSFSLDVQYRAPPPTGNHHPYKLVSGWPPVYTLSWPRYVASISSSSSRRFCINKQIAFLMLI